MPFTIHDDVPIKKTQLILDDYEIVNSFYAPSQKLKRALEVRGRYKQRFLELWEQVRAAYHQDGRCSQMLMDEYEEAKANLIYANEVMEVLHRRYGKN